MTVEEQLIFLAAKHRLIAPLIDGAEEFILASMLAKFQEVGMSVVPERERESVLRQIDAKMEKLIVEWVLDEDETVVRGSLEAEVWVFLLR